MADKKQPKSKQTSEPVDQPTGQTEESNNWLNGNLLWGGLFMLAGLLFLLGNLGLVSIAWGELWKLWPILIIIAGLSILKLRGWVAVTVYGLAILLVIGLVWVTLTGNLSSQQTAVVSSDFSVNQTRDDIERSVVKIDLGGSDLNVGSHGGDQLVRGAIDSRLSDLKYQSSVDDTTQTVNLSQERNWSLFDGGSLNKIDIELSERLRTRLHVDAGASSIDADLSAVMLESVAIDSGASTIKLKLGDKLDMTDVDIDTGVSVVSIYVPKDSGVKLLLEAGLTSQQLPEGLERVDDNKYQSIGFAEADKKINLTVDIGVSTFKLITY